MLINASSTQGITFVNRAECQMASRVLRQFPTQTRPAGRYELFKNVPPHVQAQVRRYGNRALNLNTGLHAAAGASVQPGKEADHAGSPFVPVSFVASATEVLVNGLLIIADRQTPDGLSSRMNNLAKGSINAARFLGVWLLRSEGLEAAEPALRQRLEGAYHQNHDGYHESVSWGAVRLLEAVSLEYRQLGQAAWATDPVAAIAAYRQDNPLVVQFASKL